jgi:hypothetical protein
LLASASENSRRNLWYSAGTVSEIWAISFPSFKALLISYKEMVLIWRWFCLACYVSGMGPIMVILRGAVLAESSSGGSLLVPCTVTTLSLQWARQYWEPKVTQLEAKQIATSCYFSYGIPRTMG